MFSFVLVDDYAYIVKRKLKTAFIHRVHFFSFFVFVMIMILFLLSHTIKRYNTVTKTVLIPDFGNSSDVCIFLKI